MINSYSFGKMVVDGKTYQNDLIILSDGEILSSWWRNTGHQLLLSDLKAVLDTQVKVLIVGTGNSGLMKPHPTLAAELEARGIEMIALPTTEAVDRFNFLRGKTEGVAGCFHLTC